MPNLLGRRIPTSAILQSAPRVSTGSSIGAAPSRVIGAAPTKDSGIGDVLASLGKTFENGTVRALRQAQLDKLSFGNDLSKRQATNYDPASGAILDQSLAAAAAGAGLFDPKGYALTRSVADTERNGIDSPLSSALQAGVGGFRNTTEFARREFANDLTKQGLQEQTKLAMNAAQEATKMRLAESTLEQVNGPNGPQFVRRSDAVGQTPILGMDQQKGTLAGALIPNMTPLEQKEMVLGRAPTPDPYNATLPDGSTVPATVGAGGEITDLNTGQRIPKVTTLGKLTANSADGLGSNDAIGKDVLAGRISTEKAVGLIDSLTTELDKPNAGVSVGFLGSMSEVANNIRSQVEAGSKAIGGMSAKDEMRGNDPRAVEVRQTLDKVMSENQVTFKALQAQGIDTARIRALIEDLAYAQAKANDPSGRVSNQDVERAGRQVGMGLGDPVAMKAVLGDLKERTIQSQEIRERTSTPFLGSGKSIPAWDSPILRGRKGAAAAPAAGGAPPSNLKQKYGLE